MEQQENKLTQQQILAQLTAPMSDNEIEWKVQTVIRGNKGLQALVVPYVQSRAAMQRLDDVFGLNWSCTEEVITLKDVQGIKCTITITDDNGNVIASRSDVAEPTAIEKLKGGSSDAFKRTAVKFGIGRFLYNLPSQFVPILENRPHGQNVERINSNYKVSGQQTRVSGYYIRPSLANILPKNQPNRQQQPQQPQPNRQQQPQQTNQQQMPNNNNPHPQSEDKEKLFMARKFISEVIEFFNLSNAVPQVFTHIGMPNVTSLEVATYEELVEAHKALSPVHVLFKNCFDNQFSDINIYQACSEVFNRAISSYTDLFGQLTNQQRKMVEDRLVQLKLSASTTA